MLATSWAASNSTTEEHDDVATISDEMFDILSGCSMSALHVVLLRLTDCSALRMILDHQYAACGAAAEGDDAAGDQAALGSRTGRTN